MKTSQGTATRSSGSIVSAPLELGDPPAAGDVLVERVGVDPGVVADRAVGVGDGDHLGAELLHDPRRPRADVAEALDDEGGVGGAEAEVRRRLAEHVDAAAAGGRLAAVGALERDRLAGADRRRVAVELSVLVHHPGHHLGVGVDVRRRDVAGRAEDLLDLVHERARDLLELGALELVGRAVDAALGAAEGDAGDRGLPGHQRGERADLVDVDLGVEADAALVGPAGAVVLDPVAGEDVDLAVGELDRDLDGDLAVRGPEHDPEVVGELQAVGGDLEVVADDVEVRDLGSLPRLGAPAASPRLRLLDRLRRLVGLPRDRRRVSVSGHPYLLITPRARSSHKGWPRRYTLFSP